MFLARGPNRSRTARLGPKDYDCDYYPNMHYDYYTLLYYTILCCIISYYIILYYIILYYIMVCYGISYVTLYYAMYYLPIVYLVDKKLGRQSAVALSP